MEFQECLNEWVILKVSEKDGKGMEQYCINELHKNIAGHRNKGWRMVLQKPWVSQNFCRISRVSQSRFLSGYGHLAVSIFFNAKKVAKYRFVHFFIVKFNDITTS